MANYILSCCSTADIDEAFLKEKDIECLPFTYFLDDKKYVDDLGKTMSYEEFYGKMAEGAMTKTSQPNATEYADCFRKHLRQGKDILHLSLSSGISGAYNSANIAAEMLAEEFPGRKIYVVDSLAASSGFGLLMSILAEKRNSGTSIDKLKSFAEEYRLKINHWFFTSDLKYLIRGGRVSKTAGFVGGLLNICPLLTVNKDGGLIPKEKIRTKKRVIKATYEKMVELAENGTEYDGEVYISNANCYDDARELADLIEAGFTKLKSPVKIYNIGTTIGSHTGPGTVALFFVGKERVD